MVVRYRLREAFPVLETGNEIISSFNFFILNFENLIPIIDRQRGTACLRQARANEFGANGY